VSATASAQSPAQAMSMMAFSASANSSGSGYSSSDVLMVQVAMLNVDATPTASLTPSLTPIPPSTLVNSTEVFCISGLMAGVNIRTIPSSLASIVHTSGSKDYPTRLKLTGYIDVPEVGRYYRVEGEYSPENNTEVNSNIKGWLSEQVIDTLDGQHPELCKSDGNVLTNQLSILYIGNPTYPIGTATPIPNPSPTMTPPPDFSYEFPLPMSTANALGSPLPPIRLSRCGLHNMQDTVMGLDMNPMGTTISGVPLIVPADATVVVVDRLGNDGSNGGLGNFVAIRIDISKIPPSIRQRLYQYNISPLNDPTFGSIQLDTTGGIYIGYGHLSNIETGIEIGSKITKGTIIGYSGATGNAFGAHLHVTSFFAFESFPWDVHTYGEPSRAEQDDYNWYFTIYDAAKRHSTIYGNAILINPLVLWPSAQQATNCPFWYIVSPDRS
jgi:hypothetical protein